jgi:hypothetical protein
MNTRVLQVRPSMKGAVVREQPDDDVPTRVFHPTAQSSTRAAKHVGPPGLDQEEGGTSPSTLRMISVGPTVRPRIAEATPTRAPHDGKGQVPRRSEPLDRVGNVATALPLPRTRGGRAVSSRRFKVVTLVTWLMAALCVTLAANPRTRTLQSEWKVDASEGLRALRPSTETLSALSPPEVPSPPKQTIQSPQPVRAAASLSVQASTAAEGTTCKVRAFWDADGIKHYEPDCPH